MLKIEGEKFEILVICGFDQILQGHFGYFTGNFYNTYEFL